MGDVDSGTFGAKAEHAVFGVRVTPAERAAALARHLETETTPLLSFGWDVAATPRNTSPASAPAGGKSLAEGELSLQETAEAAARRAASAQDRYGAFVSVADPTAEVARAGRAGERTALTGVPVAVKDNIAVTGMSLTANSAVLKRAVADEDAAVVERLREIGALIVGKAALDEFAFGTVGPGITNPAAPGRTVGGSSGGSAAAVAAGVCPVALGTDTGGSVRIPASCTGVVGFKPTSGWFSNRGVIPLSWSLDVIGLFARTVGDLSAAFTAIAARPAAADGPELGSLRVAVPDDHYLRVADAGVTAAFGVACGVLRAAGAAVEPAELPDSDDALDMQYLIVLSEAAEYHRQRWDVQSAEYSEGVRTALQRGSEIRAGEYLTAQRARAVLQRRVGAVLDRCDVLALPTLAVDPPPVDAEQVTLADGRTEDVVSSMLRYTALFNHTGFPAVSIPLPTADGVPRGLQLVGRHGEDAALLRVARLIEDVLAQ
jgi:aspartyl-tRNA(Asn)/glutamyl-tRNA(Gln) amidotransferase subunit A